MIQPPYGADTVSIKDFPDHVIAPDLYFAGAGMLPKELSRTLARFRCLAFANVNEGGDLVLSQAYESEDLMLAH